VGEKVYIPQYKINAFPKEIQCYDEESRAWKRGDFVIHFAGAWAHLKMDDPTGFLMRKYQEEIIE
jgi:mannan polymerase II complex MNN10 subunit